MDELTTQPFSTAFRSIALDLIGLCSIIPPPPPPLLLRRNNRFAWSRSCLATFWTKPWAPTCQCSGISRRRPRSKNPGTWRWCTVSVSGEGPDRSVCLPSRKQASPGGMKSSGHQRKNVPRIFMLSEGGALMVRGCRGVRVGLVFRFTTPVFGVYSCPMLVRPRLSL